MEKRVIDIQQIEEAFTYLSEDVKNHCLRISQYAEVVFTQIVAEDLYQETGAGRRDLVAENKKLIAEAALYHDIGKAYMPELYQTFNVHFNAEELAVYKNHIPDGINLVNATMKGFAKRKAVERHMIEDAINDHHECYDGSGYPAGKTGDEISYAGQIIGMLNYFDNLSMVLVSENPVEEAMEKMKPEVGKKFNPVFFKCLGSCRAKIKKIFYSNGASPQIIKSVDTFVKRRNRPMELEYRSIIDGEKNFIGYDTQLKFSDGKENTWTYEDVKHIISKQGIAVDTSIYFLYEGCDALRRFDTYELPSESVTIPMLPLFYTKKGIYKNLMKVLEDEEIAKEHIRVALSATMLEKPSKALIATLEEFNANGIRTIVTDLYYMMISPPALKAIGIQAVRLHADMNNEIGLDALQRWVKEAISLGIEVAIDGVDKNKNFQSFQELGVTEYTGILVSDFSKEKEMLEKEIAVRQAKTVSATQSGLLQ